MSRVTQVYEDSPEHFQRNTEREGCLFKLSLECFYIGGGSLSKLYGTHQLGFIYYTAPCQYPPYPPPPAVNINSSDLLASRPYPPSLSHKTDFKSHTGYIPYGMAIEVQ